MCVRDTHVLHVPRAYVYTRKDQIICRKLTIHMPVKSGKLICRGLDRCNELGILPARRATPAD